jgi:predicted HTH transcriptional regulator
MGNIANDQVRPTIYVTTEVVEIDGKMVLAVHVQEGKDKPYKNLAGNIWVKQGADKRRVTDNAEILGLFQDSGTYHPDEAGVSGSSYKDLDTLALDRFFENVYHKPVTEFDVPVEQMLQSLHILDKKGKLTAAGLLFFGRRPQQFFPVFVIKAVWFYGNSIAGTQYKDSRDIEGTIPEMYEQGLRWLQSCLRRTQNGQSFNSIGKLEIPETVLEELLQNALVHLDLLKTSAIRLLIFDDRVEIINPGSVMGGHTINEVMLGNSFPRNPLMANFCAKTMPYRGLGSGIPRVLSEDSDVQFVDDKAGNQFKAIIKRPTMEKALELEQVGQEVGQVSNQVKSLILCLFGNRLDKNELLESGKLTNLKNISRKTLERQYITPALKDGYVTMLYPNNLHHPKQKYYLTEKGKTLYLQLTS